MEGARRRRRSKAGGVALGAVFVAMILACAPPMAVAGERPRGERYELNIPSSDIDVALFALARETGRSLVIPSETSKGRSRALMGDYTLPEALSAMLEGTNLSGGLTDSGVITISVVRGGNEANREFDVTSDKIKKGFLAGVSAFVFGAGGASAQDAQAGEQRAAQDTIIVTATRRAQREQDVAGSLSALGAKEIAKRGITEMGDYLIAEPSVSYQGRGPGRNKVVIRGVTSGADTEEIPTTGVYINDVAISGIGWRSVFDLKTSDVERIEILRGPQGTLYGASSMGGAVKIIPKAPDLQEASAQAEAGVSSTKEGDVSYDVHAAVDLPLVRDKLGFRVTGYRHDMGGYVDNQYPGNPVFGALARVEDDVNTEVTNGVRATLLFEPNDALSVTLLGLAQRTTTGGLPESQLSYGSLTQARGIEEKLSDEFKMINLVATYDFGGVELTSSSAGINRQSVQDRDIEGFVGLPVRLRDPDDSDAFVQEVRLTSTTDADLQWLVGAYHFRMTTRPNQFAYWFGSEDGLALIGATPSTLFFDAERKRKERQTAGFADLSYHLSSSLTAEAGIRWSHYSEWSREVIDGLFNGFAHTDQAAETSESTATPRFNLSYQPNDRELFYVQAAKGFRVGRANQTVPISACAADLAALGLSQAPARANSDSLWSYEIGQKWSFADQRIQLNSAAFYIRWNDIQTNFLLPCGFSFRGNAGKAVVKGVELDLTARPVEQFLFNLSASFNDAALAEDTPAGVGAAGVKGDRIPAVPRFNLQAAGQYEWSVGFADAFVRLDYLYVGDYFNDFAQTAATRAGDYGLLNARIGLERDAVAIEIFANNLTDERNRLVSDPQFADQRVIFGRPRMIGIRMKLRG